MIDSPPLPPSVPPPSFPCTPEPASDAGRRLPGSRPLLAAAVAVLVVAATSGAASAQNSIADLLAEPGASLSDPASRARVVALARTMAEERRELARARATMLGLPHRVRRPGGILQEIVDFDGDEPVYFTTHNSRAAISSAADQVRSSYGIDGTGITIGLWDGGSGRASHQEFGGRMVVRDGASSIDHATHVGGTLIASGVSSSARGMSPGGSVDTYDWNSDTSEMAARGATAPGQAGMIYLSNHSYGYVVGWNYVNNGSRVWEWWGNGTGTTGIEQDFGRYNTYTRDQDALAYNAPYYLIFRSAGNERADNPASGQTVALSPGSPTVTTYNPATHPGGDGQYRGGYDSIGFNALAKNVITIGAVNDAVTGSSRDVAKGTMTSFSSWGPTDDGRIKPDVVANGASLYSSVNASDSSYGSASGTSMSTPSATGSAALLVQHYADLFAGSAMRSASLKGLLIHTTDDLGTAGPDYRNGWGLIDTLAAADLLTDHQASPDKQRLTEDELTTATPSRSFTFVSDGATPIRATLCWTDPAGAATSTSDLRSPRLVNDLDLKVLAPGGGAHLPYVMPFVGDWSQASMSAAATTGVNNTDNVEQVFLATPPAAGTYQLVVSVNGPLTNGAQQFSLLLSGASDAPPPPPPLTITSVSPANGLAGPVTLDLTGTGFRADTAVKLARSGYPDIAANSVSLQGESLRCGFDLGGASPGDWDVVATNPDSETFTLAAAFNVIGAIWSESFDGSSTPPGWSSDSATGSNNWTITTAASHSPTKSHFAPGVATKSTTNLVSPAIAIPAAATDMQLKFWHDYDLQSARDGGRLEFSLDGGPWFDVTDPGSGASFASNGYTTTIKGTGRPSDRSEFVGLETWSGNSNGFIETIINLTDTAAYAGHSLRMRWRLATDNRTSGPGWHVDTVGLFGGGDFGNQPPTITSAADSSSTETATDPDTTVFEIVRGSAVDLSVGADDDGGEDGLTYTWSVTDGPASPVFFSPNGTNAAKQSTASFEALGDYRLAVAVRDAEGLTVASQVNVRVLQEASSMTVAPGVVSLTVGGTQGFSATLRDQFGGAMTTQPAVLAWSATGGGPIDSSGLFTAASAGGPFVINASADGFVGIASVTVNPAAASLSLLDLAQTYDGTPKPVGVTINPPGLAVSVTYDGAPDAPVDAGSYEVAATVTDPNYQGSATDTLVIAKATATVTLDDLEQDFDGTPKPVSVTTNPPELPVMITYDGSPAVPSEAGTYAVAATVTDPNHDGDASGTLVISLTGYLLWEDLHFTEAEQTAGLADPMADPDLDRLVNLMEYALGTDPRSPGPSPIQGVVQPDGGGVQRLSLVFSRPVGLPDVQYTVQAADRPDASTWQTVDNLTITPDEPPQTETVTAWDSVATEDAPRRFLRLKVTLDAAGN